MGSPNRLMRYGWNQGSLPTGATVTIAGSQARDGSLKAAGPAWPRYRWRSKNLGFALEPRDASRVRHWQRLDRDVAPQPRVAGPIDFTYAAHADQARDLVRTERRSR